MAISAIRSSTRNSTNRGLDSGRWLSCHGPKSPVRRRILSLSFLIVVSCVLRTIITMQTGRQLWNKLTTSSTCYNCQEIKTVFQFILTQFVLTDWSPMVSSRCLITSAHHFSKTRQTHFRSAITAQLQTALPNLKKTRWHTCASKSYKRFRNCTPSHPMSLWSATSRMLNKA